MILICLTFRASRISPVSSSGMMNYKFIYIYIIVWRVSRGAVIVVIAWFLDLQLPVKSMHITTNVVSSYPAQARCTRYNIVIKFDSDLRQVCGFLRVCLKLCPGRSNCRRSFCFTRFTYSLCFECGYLDCLWIEKVGINCHPDYNSFMLNI